MVRRQRLQCRADHQHIAISRMRATPMYQPPYLTYVNSRSSFRYGLPESRGHGTAKRLHPCHLIPVISPGSGLVVLTACKRRDDKP